MTKVSFKSEPDKFLTLFPENIFDKIDKNHPAKLVEILVNQLYIKDILQKYKGGGCSAYHPRTMIKIIFYSYLSNIYSCCKMALAVKENLSLMYLAGGTTPDFRTINDFRGKT